MTGLFFFAAWLLGLGLMGATDALVRAENPRIRRAGRITFALVPFAELLVLALLFALGVANGGGTSVAGRSSFWWLMSLGYGIPLALLGGLTVRRSYAGHRPALVSAILATCVLSLAFPLGFARGSSETTGIGRFEHTHHALDVAILAIPTLILLLSEVLRWREAVDPEEASLFSHVRNASRRTVVGVVLVLAAILWLAGASPTGVGVGLAVCLVTGGLGAWWADRTAVRRVRRDLQ